MHCLIVYWHVSSCTVSLSIDTCRHALFHRLFITISTTISLSLPHSLSLFLFISVSLLFSLILSHSHLNSICLFINSFIYFLLAYFISLSSFFLSFPGILFRWRKQRFWNNLFFLGKGELLVFPNMMMTQWTAIRKMMKKMKVSWFSTFSHSSLFSFFLSFIHLNFFDTEETNHLYS